MGMEIK